MILVINSPSISTLAALSKGMLVAREHPHLQSNLEGKIQVDLQAMSGQWVSLDESKKTNRQKVLGFCFKEMWHLRMLDEI